MTKERDEKQYQLAVENYSRGLKQSPNDPTGYLGRGRAYMKLKMYEKALKDLQDVSWLLIELLIPFVGCEDKSRLHTSQSNVRNLSPRDGKFDRSY
jgi:tetratricopeptide (TPR) repeat protein